MKMIGNGTYYPVNYIPVRRFSSICPNIEFIDLAKRNTTFTRNRRRRREMINDQIAFHYAVNVYQVNSVGGIEDINRYSELPHVLIGFGQTLRAFPYSGDPFRCNMWWDNLIWSRLYDEGIQTEETLPPWKTSNPTNRTYIDIIAEGVNYEEDGRRARGIFKIIDGKMCEVWWIIGDVKEVKCFTVIDNYKTFCEMTDPTIYKEQFTKANSGRPGNVVNYDDRPFIHHFTHASLFHSNIVDVINSFIKWDPILEYALYYESFFVKESYINQPVLDNAELDKKIKFALTLTYMRLYRTTGPFEGDIYFKGKLAKLRDNPYLWHKKHYRKIEEDGIDKD